WLISLSALLVIFTKFWEPGIGVSSATYGAIAKNFSLDHQWFHLHLAPGLFDPFIYHPPLALWLDGAIFSLFGVSVQSLRLLGSVLGIAVFMSLFSVMRRRFDETTAVLSCLGLFAINVFMNFASSGWLDMPIVGFTWMGYACLEKDVHENHSWTSWAGGFLLAGAVLI